MFESIFYENLLKLYIYQLNYQYLIENIFLFDLNECFYKNNELLNLVSIRLFFSRYWVSV
jgi:hypothetical protein